MIESTEGGVRLRLFIQPKASKNEIVGEHNGELKIKLTAPPVDGAANDCLIEFIAHILKVPKKSLRITKGETSRHKTVEILGAQVATVQSLLQTPK